MRRSPLFTAAALVAVAGFGTARAADGAAPTKVTICHKTSSAKKPYVKLTIRDKATLRRHTATHHEDIVPAPAGGCPTAVLTAKSGGRKLTATLTGAAEKPGPGDADGSGSATIRLRHGQGQVCFTLAAANVILPATLAHIHVGTADTFGAPVVTLTPPAADGKSSGCVPAARELVKAILQNPAGYYVNVHTSDFPDGAIRGQLAK
jgi:hypothetical protein